MITSRVLMWSTAILSAALIASLARSHTLSLERDVQSGAVTILAQRLAVSNASLDECLQGMSEIIADGAGRDDRVAQHAAKQLADARLLLDQAKAFMDGGPTRECRTSSGAIRNKDI